MTLHGFFSLVDCVLLLLTLPLVAELFVLTLAAIPRLRPRPMPAHVGDFRLAVLIPCHNEEKLIGSCIRSVRASEIQPTAVYVVAHNCTDETVLRAEAEGACVLELADEGSGGKGAALFHGIQQALADGAEAVMIVDGDSSVDRGLIGSACAAFLEGADAVQARYVGFTGKTSRERLTSLGLYGFNVLRPRGRQNLGLSCGIFGNGFALSAATLAAVPYTAHSLVEDLEYHLRVVRGGRRVQFLNDVSVCAEMPADRAAAASQRARWEGGRVLIRREMSGTLLREVLAGRLRMLEPLLDLVARPTGTTLMLLALCLVIPVLSGRLYACFGLATIDLYLAVSVALSDDPKAMIAALSSVPRYMLFRLGLTRRTRLAGARESEWVRTERNS